MKKTTVELYTVLTTADSEGITEKSTVFSTNLKGLLLPADTIMGTYSYSYKENCSYRFFCKTEHPDIKPGNIIRTNDTDYIIVHVSDYRKIRIIYIASEVNSENRRSFSGTLRY